jgi:hypothetical protein
MVDVSGCTGLETVHLEGTNVAGIQLADASAIRELYLPASITNLTLKNQSKLETLDIADMSNIETLWVEGAMADDAIDMIDDIASSNRKLRIVGFNKTFESDSDFNDLWDKIRNSMGLDDSGLNAQYAYLNGTFTVGELKRGIYNQLSNYPFLTINYTTLGDYVYKLYLENNSKFTEYSDDMITKFRDYAFYYSPVTSINCPNVTEIGKYALSECSKLNSINLPNAIVIGDNAFYKGSGNGTASSMILGNVTTIGTSAFYGFFKEGVIDSLNLNSLQSIAGNAFKGANFSIENIRFPSGMVITSSGELLMAIGGNVKLIDIPDGAISFSIPNYAFRRNYSMTAFILRNTTMLTFTDNSEILTETPIRQAGNYSTVGQGYIYVPSALVNAYKTDWASKTNLASLVDYIRAIEDYPEICDPDYEGGE